jgi:hypothetical protein
MTLWIRPHRHTPRAWPRVEVCPPELLSTVVDRGWLATLRQLLTRQPVVASRQPNALRRLPTAREDFVAAVADMLPAATDLRERLAHARSLRELWHLRAEVYHLVSLHFDQDEADLRLSRLNRHFPTRSPRSGFGPLF